MKQLTQFFLEYKIPKESSHFICIAAISIDSVIKIDKQNCPQVYLEECRYKIKEKKMTKFIEAELELDDSDDFDYFNSEQSCFSCLQCLWFFTCNAILLVSITKKLFLNLEIFFLLRKFFSCSSIFFVWSLLVLNSYFNSYIFCKTRVISIRPQRALINKFKHIYFAA